MSPETVIESEPHVNLPEQLEGLRSSDVFITNDELFAAARSALEKGIVTAQPTTNPEVRSDVYAQLSLDLADIKLADGVHVPEKGTAYLTDKQYTITNPDKQAEEALKVQEAVVKKIAVEAAPWYLYDEYLAGKIGAGEKLSQLFKLEVGDSKVIDMINFSPDHKLTAAQLEQVKDVITRATNSMGIAAIDNVAGIVIVPDRDLQAKDSEIEDGLRTIGRYQNYNGVLFLNDALLWDTTLDTDKYGGLEQFKRLQTTLAHELAHAGQRYEWSTFKDNVGWEDKITNDVIDDYGQLRTITTNRRGQPSPVQQVFRDGKIVRESLRNFVSLEEQRQAEPNTEYGTTNDSEDFAESAVPFLLEGRQTEKIDKIRSNALSVTFHNQAVSSDVLPEHGPYIVKLEEIKQPSKPELSIPERNLRVAVQARVHIAPEKDYNQSKYVTDDYGNRVSALPGVWQKYY